MKFENVKIYAPHDVRRTKITVNGEPVSGVTKVQFTAEVGAVNEIVLTIIPAGPVEIEAEAVVETVEESNEVPW